MDLKKIQTIKKAKPLAAWDFVLAAVLVLLIVVLFVISFSSQKAGAAIEIYKGNELIGTYRLDEDRTITIPVDGGLSVIVKIEDGYAYVEESNTPRRICEFGKINKAPQQLICLPHAIVIRVVSDEQLKPGDIGDIIVG